MERDLLEILIKMFGSFTMICLAGYGLQIVTLRMDIEAERAQWNG